MFNLSFLLSNTFTIIPLESIPPYSTLSALTLVSLDDLLTSVFIYENIEDLNQSIKVTETDIETGFVRDSRTSDEGYHYTVLKENKMYVMIESLFNERFELDKHAWNEDYNTHQIFMSDEEAALSDSVVIASYRLKNPIQNYVKRKD